jgi:hypothetical protein
MAEVKKLSETHHQMMLWLVQNPGKPLSAMSEKFGYTVPWLSSVINSSLFQARLQELQKAEDVCVLADIPSQLRGVTSMALDTMAEQVDKVQRNPTMADREYVKEVVELGLKNLGFGQPKPGVVTPTGTFMQQNNTFVSVGPEVLERARQKLLERNGAISEASKLLAGGDSSIRTVQSDSPAVFEQTSPARTQANGNPL